MNALLSTNSLRDALIRKYAYDPDTGIFYHRSTGKAVGSGVKKLYINLYVDGGRYGAHRMAYLYAYNRLPEAVDHINSNGLDNRLCNLREATLSENQFNRKLNGNNTLGLKNISKNGNHYQFDIQAHGVRYSYRSKEMQEVIDVAVSMRESLHRKFARHA